MATEVTPPLPAGFVINKAPALPAGFVIDKPKAEGADTRTGADLIPGMQPQGPAPKQDSFSDMLSGVGEAARTMATGIAAPVKALIQSLPGTGVRPPGGFMERMGADVYKPQTQTGQNIVSGVGKAAEGMQALGPEFGGYGSLMKGAGEAASLARPGVAMSNIKAPIAAAAKSAMDVPAVRTLRGLPAAELRRSAEELQGLGQAATRGALADTSQRLGALDKVRATAQAGLDAAKTRGTPPLDAIGGSMGDAYGKAVGTAKTARETAVKPLYDTALAQATARERDGARIDVTPALKDLEDLMAQSENVADLQGKLARLQAAVKGAPAQAGVAAPVGSGKVSGRMAVPVSTTPVQPLTYAELDVANRYIKDIAYHGETEGYSALIRNAAKNLANKLDTQIAQFVPEHAAAAAKYRELSAPLDTLGTKVGRALFETEGGLSGGRFAKVSPQDLPNNIFSKRDKIEQLVEGLAGGPNASKEAKLAAQAQVDTWVENWVLTKNDGKVGQAGLDFMRNPQNVPSLNAAPRAQSRLTSKFTKEAEMESQVGTGESAVKARTTIDGLLKDADELSSANSAEYQKEAYNAYISAMRRMVKTGDMEESKFKAAVALIDRAGAGLEESKFKAAYALTDRAAAGFEGAAALQAKTNLARKLAKGTIVGGAALSGVYTANKAFGP